MASLHATRGTPKRSVWREPWAGCLDREIPDRVSDRRMRVLCLAAYYLPGFKSGGPVRTIAHMAAHLRDQIDFHIITSDRDQGDAEPYPNVPIDRWTSCEGVNVFYMSPDNRTAPRIAALIRATAHDVLY